MGLNSLFKFILLIIANLFLYFIVYYSLKMGNRSSLAHQKNFDYSMRQEHVQTVFVNAREEVVEKTKESANVVDPILRSIKVYSSSKKKLFHSTETHSSIPRKSTLAQLCLLPCLHYYLRIRFR